MSYFPGTASNTGTAPCTGVVVATGTDWMPCIVAATLPDPGPALTSPVSCVMPPPPPPPPLPARTRARYSRTASWLMRFVEPPQLSRVFLRRPHHADRLHRPPSV